MKRSAGGRRIAEAGILNTSASGIWLFVLDKQYFLPYAEYPWFKDAAIKAILNVRLLNRIHLHWPDLDIDLEVQSLERPDHYPLQHKTA